MASQFNPATAVDYGQFIVAAYTMYENDPTDLNPSKSSDFPSGFDLAATVQMSDFFGPEEERKFYGFIAVSTSGPTTWVLAIRGTAALIEWWDDFHWGFVPFAPVANGGQVAEGFLCIYQTLGVLDRVELRNDLADDALAAGDQQIGDRHRDGHGRRMADGVSERSLEQVRDRRFAERADGDRGHRDPNLAGRDVVADLLELLEGEARAARALLGKRLQPSPPRAHERVLRDHEERVDQDKQPGHDDQERRHEPFSALGP